MFQIPANYANSMQFTHIVHKLREICRPIVNLLHVMFQAPALAEKAKEFQQITQIPRSSPT